MAYVRKLSDGSYCIFVNSTKNGLGKCVFLLKKGLSLKSVYIPSELRGKRARIKLEVLDD